jgi:stage II sporulation protein AA (anti-sigma F factor antagonist)
MDLKWPLRIVEERRDGVLVLALTGRLSAASAVRLDAAVANAVRRGNVRLVIDLAGVDYVSSAGLRALGSAAGLCVRARGALVLCGLAAAVRIALDLSGFLPDLTIEPSREQAIVRVATPVAAIETDVG